MLRGLELRVGSSVHALRELRWDASCRDSCLRRGIYGWLLSGKNQSSEEYAPVLAAFDVARVVGQQPIQVLGRVRGSEGPEKGLIESGIVACSPEHPIVVCENPKLPCRGS